MTFSNGSGTRRGVESRILMACAANYKNPAGSNTRTQEMKTRLEQLLHLASAAVTLGIAVGLDTSIAMPLLATINIGQAVVAGIRS
jgi:hypothetical protein